MATLPNPEELQRARLQPATGIVSYQDGQVGAALETAGRVMERTVERAQHFADQTAELHARDAMIQLKRQRNLLTVGDEGYARLQNGAATEPGVLDKYKQKYNTAAGGLAAKLSPIARQKFESMARADAMEYEADILRHMMREDLNHRGEVYNAQVNVISETMGLNYNNPDAILRERASLDRTVADYVAKQGVKDPALIERMLQDARGRGHQQVITAYLDNGQASNAEAYFNAIKQEMLPEQAKAVNNMLKPEIANAVGREVSDKLFQMHVAGESETAIFNEKLRLTEGRSHDVVRAIDSFYNDRVKALEADRIQASGNILLSVWNGEQGSGLRDPRLREIDRTDPILGAKLRGQIEAIQKRNAEPVGGAVKQPVDMALYGQLVDAVRDGKLTSAEEIAQFAPHLPKSEIKSLMTLQGSLESAAGKARIPTALINAGTPKSAQSDKTRRDAYKGFVELKLQEWKDANPGKVPTLDEQKAIIASASEEHVEVSKYWFNRTVEAYRTEGRTTYPKAFGQLMQGYSADDILAAYSFAQQVRARLTKQDAPVTDAEAIEMWRLSVGK